MRHMNENLRRVVFGLVLGLLLAGCGEQVQEAAPDLADHSQKVGLDETLDCAEGEVGWRFPTEALDKSSEAYDSRAGENAEVEFVRRSSIDVASYTCSGAASESGLSALRRACNGTTQCDFEDLCATPLIKYRCTGDEADADGNDPTYTLTSSDVAEGSVSLACAQPEDATETVEARTACIPEQCHGRTRRNLDMECVPDNTKVETTVGAYVNKMRPLYKPQTDSDLTKAFAEDIYPNMPYEFEMTAYFKRDLVPETSSFIVWFEDVFEHSETREQTAGYRCTAFKLDINKNDPSARPGSMLNGDVDDSITAYDKTVKTTLSKECFEDRIVFENAARNADLSADAFAAKLGSEYEYKGTKMRISYDMEGRSVWHKGAPHSFTLEQLAQDEPECAPNPPAFYYDSQSETYDMRGYYAQRALNWEQSVWMVKTTRSRRAEIGTIDIKPRRELKIRTQSSYNPSLPIEISWYAVNYHDGNPFNPFPTDKPVGRAWQNGSDANENPEDYNWGPVNLRASIYAFPVDGTFKSRGAEVFNKLGDMPLKDPNPDGKTDTANIAVTDRIKKMFLDPNSNTYVEGDVQAFDLFYCIESDHPTPRAYPEQYTYAFNPKWGGGGMPINYAIDPDAPGSSVYLESEEATAAREPAQTYGSQSWGYWGQDWRGCRRSKTPLIVRVDRFATPLEPFAEYGFDGYTSGTTAGDDKMSGTNDNDSEVVCQDDSKKNCKEVMKGGNRTDGEGSGSTYDITGALDRTPGDKVSADIKGEMLAMQLLDMADPGESEASWPGDGSPEPVVIRVEPDWDTLRENLDRQFQSNPAVDWDTGHYGGAMGLGVGWGFKFRWQVGPVPVLVTFSITVGASLDLAASFYFAPEPGDGYPCLDETEPCYEVSSDAATFAEANDACSETGGRLAELSSAAEAAKVEAILPSGEDAWLGGMLAYRHAKPQCATTYNEAACASGSKTEYRWLSNAVAFASNDGRTTPNVDDGELYADYPNLTTQYPNHAAVYYANPSGLIKTASVDEKKQYICVYEPAGHEDYLKWTLELTTGFAAGISLEGCTPDDNIGFCLGASINAVALTLQSVFENTYHWIAEDADSEPFARRGTVGFSIPWEISVFQAEVKASLKFLWFTLEYILLRYDGITLDEGKLFDWSTTVMEDF